MKTDKTKCIEGNLLLLKEIIDAISCRVNTALDDLDEHDDNTVVGGLIGMEQPIEQAKALYGAILAAHRFQSYGGK